MNLVQAKDTENHRHRRIDDTSQIGFIQQFFEVFYQRLLRHYNTVEARFSSGAGAEDSTPGVSEEETVAQTREILNDLHELLESQAFEASKKGGEFAVDYYSEAQFVMAALADELFLNTLDWPGKQYWTENLLEGRIFGTHDAGDLFFQKLNDFLENRDPLRTDIAEVYLLALGLGFEGKYRGMPDQRQLDHYRKELYIFINHQEPKFYRGSDRLFAQAYSHTLNDGSGGRFKDIRFWTTTFVFVASILLFLSFVIWNNATRDLEVITDSILSNRAQKT